MVEVTSSNFESLLPDIEAAIAGAAFVAIDTEFTGLVREPDAAPSLFDSIEARYKKLRQTVSSYVICQLGLCTFTPVPSENAYRASAYSIYLCPRSFGDADPQFSVQASSVEFLCQNGFDFNKCFYKGLSYVDRISRRAVDSYLAKNDLLDSTRLQPLLEQVRRWLSSPEKEAEVTIAPPAELNIQLVAAVLRASFPDVRCELQPEGLVLTSAQMPKSQHTGDPIRDSLLGFSRCFDTLVKSGKPLVGHNMLLDLLLLYNQFEEPLPTSYSRLKHSLRRLFPLVYDTKHISLSLRQQSNAWLRDLLAGSDLFALYRALIETVIPFSPCIEGAPATLRPHDAGSDAYVAGVVFLKLAHILAQQGHSSVPSPTPKRPLSWPQHQDALHPFSNRINLIRAQSHHVCLEGPDVAGQERPPWLCVQSQARSQAELEAVLAKCGAVDIRSLSSSCLLVAVGSFACARDIVTAFRDDPQVSIVRYRRIMHDPRFRKSLWAAALLGIALTTSCALGLVQTRFDGQWWTLWRPRQYH